VTRQSDPMAVIVYGFAAVLLVIVAVLVWWLA
jgi:hypothetical protein